MKRKSLVCAVMVCGVFIFGGVNSGGEKKPDPAFAAKSPPDGSVTAKSEEDKLTKLAKARLDTAEKAFRAWKKSGTAALNTPEDMLLYDFSWRWLNAELETATGKEKRIAAYEAHFLRMKDWEVTVKKIGGSGSTIPVVVESFRAEAEYWLAKERLGKKQ